MDTDAATFFTELGRRGQEPLLRKAAGRARFDLVDGEDTEHWLLTIDQGAIRVSRENADADVVVRADKAFFDRVIAGERNMMAAALRGEVELEGDPRKLVLLQRIVPRPSARQPQPSPSVAARRES